MSHAVHWSAFKRIKVTVEERILIDIINYFNHQDVGNNLLSYPQFMKHLVYTRT